MLITYLVGSILGGTIFLLSFELRGLNEKIVPLSLQMAVFKTILRL